MTEQHAIKAIQNDLEWHSKELKPAYKEVLRMAIQALEEIQAYRAIGTIEECRTAVERMKPKKPRVYANGTRHCPNEDCEEVIYTSDEYCLKCGTKIDWSE